MLTRLTDNLQLVVEFLPPRYAVWFILYINTGIKKYFDGRPSITEVFWQKKVKQYFPYQFSTLSLLKKVNTQFWFNQYKTLQTSEYKTLSTASKKIFEMAKGGEIEEIKTVAIKQLAMTDSSSKTCLDWAFETHNQQLLDNFYTIVEAYYGSNSSTLFLLDSSTGLQANALYWAIKCAQKKSVISELITKGCRPHSYCYQIGYSSRPSILLPLDVAVETNQLETMRYFIEDQKIDFNQPSTLNNRPIYSKSLERAVNKDHADMVQLLLEKKADSDILGEDDLYLLQIAAKKGHLAVVQCLVNHQAQRDPQQLPAFLVRTTISRSLFPALTLAAEYGHAEVVEFLISKGAPLPSEEKIFDDSSPLTWTLRNNHFGVLAVLVKYNTPFCKILKNNEYFVDKLFKTVIETGQLKLLEELLTRYPLLLNIRDSGEHTMLASAVKAAQLEIVKFLLTYKKTNLNPYGIDINQESKYRGTALQIACDEKNWEVCHLLIAAGAKTTSLPRTSLSYLLATAITQHVLPIVVDSIKSDASLLTGIIQWENNFKTCKTTWELALEKGSHEIIHFLFTQYTKEQDKLNALRKAIETNQLSIVKMILETYPHYLDAGITDKNHDKTSPLFIAAESGHAEIVSYLLARKADIHHVNQWGDTPLAAAVEKKHEPIVQLLIEAKADISEGIIAAASTGQQHLVRKILQHNPEAHSIVNSLQENALLYAASIGHTGILEDLHKAGSTLEIKTQIKEGIPLQIDHHNKGPLHWAAQNGHQETVKYLLEQKVSLEDLDEAQETPLVLALQKGRQEVVELLLAQGADTIPAIHISAEKGRLDLVRAALEKAKAAEMSPTAALERPDCFRQTPLIWAASNGHVEIVNYLLTEGASIYAETIRPSHDDHGKTALYWAWQHKKHDVVAVLLKKAGISALKAFGSKTPLPKVIIQAAETVAQLAAEGRLDDEALSKLAKGDVADEKITPESTGLSTETVTLKIIPENKPATPASEEQQAIVADEEVKQEPVSSTLEEEKSPPEIATNIDIAVASATIDPSHLSALKKEIDDIVYEDKKSEILPNPEQQATIEFKRALGDLLNMLHDEKDNPRTHTIATATTDLLIELRENKNQTQTIKLAIIKKYAEKCKKQVSNWSTLGKCLGCVVAAAVGFVVGAVVGAGIGLLAGAWSGPGAALTGAIGFFTGGAKGAAMAISLSGAATSITAGVISAKYVFFKPTDDKLDRAVNQVIRTAKASLKRLCE